MTRDEIILGRQEFLYPALFHYYDKQLVIARARDQYVWDADGKQYLDFFGGIVTISVGHCNQTVNEKIHAQVDTLQHVSTVFTTEPLVKLAAKVASLTPGGKLTKSFFTNSGTEANETAILTARCYTGSSEVIALRHSYHGRSAYGMALTGQAAWKLGGTPQPGVVHAHNAYCYRCPFGLEYPACDIRCGRDVKELIQTATSGRVAAFIAEPIQGVGGVVVPPPEYFQVVEAIVREHGGLMISDEVQTGWGRTGGKWFGIEQYGVVPDIITGAKGLGNGSPIGLTVAKSEVADAVRGVSISTFGGNAVSAAAAHAVLEFIEQNSLSENAFAMGEYLREKLLALKEKYSLVGDVRGMGLLQGLELVADRRGKEPAPVAALRALEAARENGLLLGKGGLYSNVLRITPPLNIGRADIDEFARILDVALDAAVH